MLRFREVIFICRADRALENHRRITASVCALKLFNGCVVVGKRILLHSKSAHKILVKTVCGVVRIHGKSDSPRTLVDINAHKEPVYRLTDIAALVYKALGIVIKHRVLRIEVCITSGRFVILCPACQPEKI